MVIFHWLSSSTVGSIVIGLIAVTAWFLTFLHHWGWALPAFAVTLFLAVRTYFYLGRPWRRVHFPMLRTYAESAAIESSLAESEGREFANLNALTSVVYHHWKLASRQQAQIFVEKCLKIGVSTDDVNAILAFASSRTKNETWLAELRTFLEEANSRSDRGLEIKLIVAARIQEKHGFASRIEYLYEIFTGRPN